MKRTAMALLGLLALPTVALASDVHSYSGYGCVTEQPGIHRVTLSCSIPAAVNGLESGIVSYRINEVAP